MKIVCIDTQILSWAIVKNPPAGNSHLVSVARDFMQWVNDQQFRVIVPSIVVSELLIPVPPEEHPIVLSQFSTDYRIVPFDLACARKFAEMRRHHIIQNRLKELLNPKQLSATKSALKADVMIIATAITFGAETLYSHNDDMRNMATGFIEALSFDEVSFQRSLGFSDTSTDELE